MKLKLLKEILYFRRYRNYGGTYFSMTLSIYFETSQIKNYIHGILRECRIETKETYNRLPDRIILFFYVKRPIYESSFTHFVISESVMKQI